MILLVKVISDIASHKSMIKYYMIETYSVCHIISYDENCFLSVVVMSNK